MVLVVDLTDRLLLYIGFVRAFCHFRKGLFYYNNNICKTLFYYFYAASLLVVSIENSVIFRLFIVTVPRVVKFNYTAFCFWFN